MELYCEVLSNFIHVFMKTENPITASYLKSIGFRQSHRDVLIETGDLCEVMTLNKGNFRVDCTFTYGIDDEINLFFEINGEILNGKQMTIARLQNLIALL